ncbi:MULTISPECIES: hypothetical protein [unclassified Haladaptatus]|uniref:hypothetical protein n=1 Tax=unclassified Haladaptatus TaxID=2622732 RepID=UPI0023E8C4A6|nr:MULTISPECIES: hypothetical protein [unclassified Haladaptatus]
MRALGYRTAVVVADLAALASVAGVLVAAYLFLPVAIQEQLTLTHDAIRPVALLTASYVHLSAAHLWNNVVGFASVSVVVYLTCLLLRRRRWFWTTSLCFLVAVPILVSLSSYALLATAHPGAVRIESKGFSGVVAAFGGFLFVTLLVWVRTHYSREQALYVGQIVAIVLLAELLIIYASTLSILELGLVSLGIGLPLGALGYRTLGPTAAIRTRHTVFDVGFVVLVCAMLAALVYGLFPAQIVASGAVTNVYAHFAGFVWGVLFAWLLEKVA